MSSQGGEPQYMSYIQTTPKHYILGLLFMDVTLMNVSLINVFKSSYILLMVIKVDLNIKTFQLKKFTVCPI